VLKGLTTPIKYVPMAHKDSFPYLAPNHLQVEELNKKYLTMFQDLARQISYMTQIITPLCKLVSKIPPVGLENAAPSPTKISENLTELNQAQQLAMHVHKPAAVAKFKENVKERRLYLAQDVVEISCRD